ncbi:ribosome rescue GTPase HflX [Actinobacillus pleuropneumoniae]|uniref:GTPase HflX n=2 Tax=Actinobacillus pleuropneumoniae TaxID=715 RepID=A0ABM6X5B3_ACTPL|nr:ribosome rescue GTPase HflX [Actinobacillus pleuropneumoniae]AWG96365.1 GTPase HflX [Actinobacillus pleuropneumoniae serovar 1 str. 4074]AXA22435.1 GTPase HflX [Actinobacillus pleuropneumoniae]MEE3671351.1 ribosome rescue GTPase HflX [Actinobacillus pleuropneumoniae]UKH31761.1 GTPase HflX [Actinobacillus pleuropneumoniae serovar 11 str. 56153]UKH35901.1 GTPase HflX [Actinobacillus pleuropneumoniae serovar 9 str. CVJ13261]
MPNTDENAVFGFALSENGRTADKELSHTKDKAILVHLFLSQHKDIENLMEFQTLAESAGVEILATLTTSAPHIKYFVGQGKADEIAQAVKDLEATVVLVNHELSPSQTRNLQALCECRVVDRTGLILDIFAQRARSHEGKLQVELAQLKHLATRLVRRLGNQDQQKGGAVGLRGPGETQLETDRRLIKVRIQQLQNRLEKVNKQRSQNRKTRQKADIPTVSLVGYTNAGKSTLFNAITNAGVYAADQLFATLDPTLRRMQIQDVGTTILADTVGFIRFLPHDLVSAFKSTLQETTEASLLLHVIDAADDRKNENIDAVNQVLDEIGALEVPTLLIYNKVDKLEGVMPHIERNDNGKPVAVYLSAQANQGIDLLYEAIRECLRNELVCEKVLLPATSGQIYTQFHLQRCIKNESFNQFGDRLVEVEVDLVQWNKWLKQFPELTEYVEFASWAED